MPEAVSRSGVIRVFRVSPESADAFRDAWRKRDSPQSSTENGPTIDLYECVRPDAEYRFVSVGDATSDEVLRDEGASAGVDVAGSSESHSARYDVIRHDGDPFDR